MMRLTEVKSMKWLKSIPYIKYRASDKYYWKCHSLHLYFHLHLRYFILEHYACLEIDTSLITPPEAVQVTHKQYITIRECFYWENWSPVSNSWDTKHMFKWQSFSIISLLILTYNNYIIESYFYEIMQICSRSYKLACVPNTNKIIWNYTGKLMNWRSIIHITLQ